jgi:hypothetical protein
MAQVSPLRRRMIEDMTVRNLSPATQRSYLNAVSKFSRYFGRSPDHLGLEDVHAFQVHLVAMGISWPALWIVSDKTQGASYADDALLTNRLLCTPQGWARQWKTAGLSEASGRFTEDVPAERSYPWHGKPHQRGGLERKAKTECGPIGRDRIMSVLRRPLLDYEPDAVLHRERPAKVQVIQSAIGARGTFFGEVVGYDPQSLALLRHQRSIRWTKAEVTARERPRPGRARPR